MRIILPAFGLMALATANTPALATPATPKPASIVFEKCDGLIRGGLADDTFEYVRTEGGIYLREDPKRYNAEGAEACGRALADPDFAKGHAQRHANLLQSRALHLIAASELPGALAALDAADHDLATVDDPLMQRSLGARIALIRAWILARQGNSDAALHTLATVTNAYPWSPSYGRTIARLRLSIDHDLPAYIDAIERLGRQSPDEYKMLLRVALAAGQFEQARRIAPFIRYDVPIVWQVYGSFIVPGDDLERADAIKNTAEARGAAAYATAALGQVETARAQIAAARAEIAATLARLPTEADETTLNRDQRATLHLQRFSAMNGNKLLDSWAAAIDLLAWKATGAATPPPADLDRLGNNLAPIAAHLTARLPVAILANSHVAQLAALADRLQPALQEMMATFGLDQLVTQLPQPENRHIFPPIKRAGTGFSRVQNGYSRTLKSGTSLYTIRFQRDEATALRAEEAAVLAAALYAAHDGKDSILILNRRTLTQVRTGPGVQYAQGYENQMDALLVDAGSLPENYAPYRDRLIPVARIMAEVRPAYDVRELPN